MISSNSPSYKEKTIIRIQVLLSSSLCIKPFFLRSWKKNLFDVKLKLKSGFRKFIKWIFISEINIIKIFFYHYPPKKTNQGIEEMLLSSQTLFTTFHFHLWHTTFSWGYLISTLNPVEGLTASNTLSRVGNGCKSVGSISSSWISSAKMQTIQHIKRGSKKYLGFRLIVVLFS